MIKELLIYCIICIFIFYVTGKLIFSGGLTSRSLLPSGKETISPSDQVETLARCKDAAATIKHGVNKYAAQMYGKIMKVIEEKNDQTVTELFEKCKLSAAEACVVTAINGHIYGEMKYFNKGKYHILISMRNISFLIVIKFPICMIAC